MLKSMQRTQICIDRLIKLALASWRLNNWISEHSMSGSETVVRHSGRMLSEFIHETGISFLDFRKQPYDAGLCVSIVDIVEDPRLPPNSVVIHETICPTILFAGQVVAFGQVVLGRNLSNAQSGAIRLESDLAKYPSSDPASEIRTEELSESASMLPALEDS